MAKAGAWGTEASAKSAAGIAKGAQSVKAIRILAKNTGFLVVGAFVAYEIVSGVVKYTKNEMTTAEFRVAMTRATVGAAVGTVGLCFAGPIGVVAGIGLGISYGVVDGLFDVSGKLGTVIFDENPEEVINLIKEHTPKLLQSAYALLGAEESMDKRRLDSRLQQVFLDIDNERYWLDSTTKSSKEAAVAAHAFLSDIRRITGCNSCL